MTFCAEKIVNMVHTVMEYSAEKNIKYRKFGVFFSRKIGRFVQKNIKDGANIFFKCVQKNMKMCEEKSKYSAERKM